MIQVQNVTISYGEKVAVNKVTADFSSGFECIIGPNGSGKTTLLKAISNLIGFEGDIQCFGSNVKSMKPKDISKRVSMFAQNHENYFSFSVYETILQGRYPYTSGLFGYTKKDEEIVLNIIRELDLSEFIDRQISTLSGGELQRVFLARCLVQEPDVLLLDEPTNHLDLKYQVDILEYIDAWRIKNGKIVIAVLHDLHLVQKYASRVHLLERGVLISSGDTKEVLGSKLLEEVYQLDVKQWSYDLLKRWQAC